MSKKLLSGPYLLWMIGFTVIPLALIVFYGLTDRSGAFTLANVLSFFATVLYLNSFISFVTELLSTSNIILLFHYSVKQKKP